ncbi:hypothetical protein [Streptomyces lavendulae]|uniref:hypothetical protein n=1 Tax=Streptomyces lavendulae TaxID=1914 RepID=UPI0038032618
MTTPPEPEQFNLQFRSGARAAPPYAYKLDNRDANNLNNRSPGPNSVDLGRHHIIDLSSLKQAWDKLIEIEYNKQGSELKEELAKLCDAIGVNCDRYAGSGDGTPTPDSPGMPSNEVEALRDFVGNFRTAYEHDPSESLRPPGWDELIAAFSWIPGNILTGPLNAHRFDDPDKPKNTPRAKFEDYCGIVVGPDEYRRFSSAFDSMNRYRLNPKNPKFAAEGKAFLRAYTEIASGRDRAWPLKNSDWVKFSGGRCYGLEHPGVQPKGCDKPFTGQVANAGPGDRIEIGDSVLVLELWDDDEGSITLGASAENIRMGDFIDWVVDQWGAGSDIPQDLKNLVLEQITLEIYTSPGSVDYWRFTVATEIQAGGASAPILIRFDYGDNGTGSATFSLSAEVGFLAGNDDESPRFWFNGGITKTGNSWSLNASLESDTPISLFDLADSLGVPGADTLRDLLPSALRPELRSVSLLYGPDTGFVVGVRLETVSVTLASVPVSGPPPGSVWCVQVTLSVSAGLSTLPVVGKSVPPAGDLNVIGVRGVYASASLDGATLARMNQLVDRAGLTPFPALQMATHRRRQDAGLPSGGVLGMDYRTPGSSAGTLLLPLPATPPAGAPLPAEPAPTPAP